LAALAAFGLQALLTRDPPLPDPPPRGGRGRVTPTLVIAGIALAALSGVFLMVSMRGGLLADPGGSVACLQQRYLSLRHHAAGLGPAGVARPRQPRAGWTTTERVADLHTGHDPLV